MRLCLINPPMNLNLIYKNRYSPDSFPHAGLGYIAAILDKNGFKTDVLECIYPNLRLKDIYKIVYTVLTTLMMKSSV